MRNSCDSSASAVPGLLIRAERGVSAFCDRLFLLLWLLFSIQKLVRFFRFFASCATHRPAEHGLLPYCDHFCSATTPCSSIPLAIVDVFDSKLVRLFRFFASWATHQPAEHAVSSFCDHCCFLIQTYVHACCSICLAIN
jgi:hypothetical protein